MNILVPFFRDRRKLVVLLGQIVFSGGLAASGLAQPQIPAPAPVLPAAQPSSPTGSLDLLPADRSIGNRRVFGRLVPVFFPPQPPPLGMAPSFAERRVLQLNAPEELAGFVNEPFYAPLSARLASREAGAQLDGEQERRLESFRANKTALQTELKARLYTLRESDPAARRQALEAFAREQTPQLIELERTAEDLRSELARATDAGNASVGIVFRSLRFGTSITKITEPGLASWLVT